MITTLDPQTTQFLENFQALPSSEQELVTQITQAFKQVIGNEKENNFPIANALDPQTAQYLEVFQALTPTEQEIVTQALKQFLMAEEEDLDPAMVDLAEEIAGRTFTRQERIELEIETLVKHFQHRRQLLESALSAPQVAKLLGTSRQTPHDRVNSQSLLAIKDNGQLRFPAWQFDPEGPDGVIDGLPATLKALNMSDYTKLNWLTRTNPYLEGQTPIQALKAGEKERIVVIAATV